MRTKILLLGFLASSCIIVADAGENNQQPQPISSAEGEIMPPENPGNYSDPCQQGEQKIVTIEGREYVIEVPSICDPYWTDHGRPPEKQPYEQIIFPELNSN